MQAAPRPAGEEQASRESSRVACCTSSKLRTVLPSRILKAITELAMPIRDEIETSILALLSHRAVDSSICPSEVARALAPDSDGAWRNLMPTIRAVAATLASVGRVQITRGGREVSGHELEAGPIRLRRGPRFILS